MTPTASVDGTRIGELLDDAIEAANRGDLGTAHDLAGHVLEEDSANQEAEALLATEDTSNGELRRLTILCCDLVGSTELSERHDPERYRTLVSRYRSLCRSIIETRFDGHIVSVKGDGFLALFGYPQAHEDDTRRAVTAGLDLCTAMRQLSIQSQREVGEPLDLRVGIHRGLVFVDVEDDDVYGLAANLASRIEGLAAPGSVSITDDVRRLVDDHFEVAPGTLQLVKGISVPVQPFTVLGERTEPRIPHFPTPLVGRSGELAALRAACTGSTDRPTSATSVLIRGEPGVGKSRLAAALAQEALVEGSIVIELSGSPFHVDAGFHPIRVLIEARSDIGRDTTAPERLRRLRREVHVASADVERAVSLLAPILGLAPSAGYKPFDAEGRKLNEEISGAAYDYLIGCFGGGPGLLVVEDLHWLDESSLALLAQVLDHGPGGLRVILTSREDSPFRVGSVVDVGPFLRADCMELLDALDPVGLSAQEREAIAERSDGIPLFLEELVRTWVSGRPLDGVPSGENVPESLYEPLLARLMSTHAGVAVAGAAATIGRQVDRSLLAALVDLDPDQLERELEALTEGRILLPSGRAGQDFRFRHELLRGVAYDLQPPPMRRRIHARVADLLVLGAESNEVVDWILAATHYEHGRRPSEAAMAYEHAADSARRRGALSEARNHLGRSIALIADLPDGPERRGREVALRLRRGFLATSSEYVGSAEAAGDYARCLELAMADAQGDEMFSSLISLWAYHVSRAELDRARQVLQLLRSSLQGSREWFRPANSAGFGMLSWFEGDFEEARQVLEESVANLGAQQPEQNVDDVWFVPNDPVASMHTHLALARFMCGDYVGAESELAKSSAVTAALDFPQGPWSSAYGLWMGSWMRAERGDFDAAEKSAADLLELASRHGFDSWAMIASTQQASIGAARCVGSAARSDEAASHAAVLGNMVGMWQMLDLLLFLPHYLTTIAAALTRAGDVDGARARLEEALALGDTTGMRFYAAEASRLLAHLAGNPVDVELQLRSALGLAQAQGARPFELRIAVDLHDLVGAAALPSLEAAVAGFSAGSSSAHLDAARARLATRH